MIAIILCLMPMEAADYEQEIRMAVAPCDNWRQWDSDRKGVTYENTLDRSSLRVRAYQCRSRDIDRSWDVHNTSAVRYNGPNVPFSNLPLGTHVRRYDSASSVLLSVRNGDTFTWIQMQRRGTGPKGSVTWHTADRDGDRLDAEGIARRLIALVEGRWSTADGEATFHGVRLQARRGRDGQRFVPLSGWAGASGVSVHWNRRLGTASFTYSGRPYIVALGARSIKVGDTWREIGDTIMMRSDDWYVPTSGLTGH